MGDWEPRERRSRRGVAEFAFTKWAERGRLRHPRYVGLRRGTAPAEVTREKPSA